MKKRNLLLMLIFLFTLTACSTKDNKTQDNSLVIGFSQSGIESSWRKYHTQSIRSELTEKNQVLYRNGYMDQDKQIQDIRTFIAYKVDAIILSPLKEDGWQTVLQEAKKAKIPVFVVDRHINVSDTDLFVTHIGPNFKAQGNRAGLFVKNYFADKKQKQINVLELKGLENTSVSSSRAEGFKETIAQDKRIKIADELTGDFIRAKGKEEIQKYIKEKDISDIDVLYSHNDEMTLGALEALKNTSIIPGKDLVIVTIDGQEEAIEQLKKGNINCVVENNPDAGWFVANALDKYFAKEKNYTLPKEIYMSETVFSENNLSSIPTRNY